jgi:hypothetical protein
LSRLQLSKSDAMRSQRAMSVAEKPVRRCRRVAGPFILRTPFPAHANMRVFHG